jgi:hypothetical protein
MLFAEPPEQAMTLKSLPPDASTVTNWYRQNVYDPSDERIGEISDVLVDRDGKIAAFMVSVGSLLGRDAGRLLGLCQTGQHNGNGGREHSFVEKPRICGLNETQRPACCSCDRGHPNCDATRLG